MIDLLTGLTIGLHVASVHLPAADFLSGVNPGAYVRTTQGLTLGGYRNSFGRASFYVGYTYELGPFALTGGIVSGYQMRTVSCWGSRLGAPSCYDGNTRGAIGPMLAPSVRLPSVLGVSPRITYAPKVNATGHNVVHFSLEHTL